jgi:RNA polymerase sigma-70 factor (ECF subfamily)
VTETLTGPDLLLEQFRTELTGYCYRMLGSSFEAEDAVQEAMLRAWRSMDRFDERRGSLRTWLYQIATNICFDILRGAQRRALAMDFSTVADAASVISERVPERAWIHPVPDARVLPVDGDPEELAIQRETIRLAFVAALQHLPPRQRAVLILRDVLCWKADEVAHLLETSVASTTSALQRARSTLKAAGIAPGETLRPSDPAQRELLARYCDAFERHDITALVALIREDATMSMPPFTWWLQGIEQIRRVLLDPAGYCLGARLVPVAASASPAFWQVRPVRDDTYEPFGLVILDVLEGRIGGITTYLDVDRLIPLFGRPLLTHRSVP